MPRAFSAGRPSSAPPRCEVPGYEDEQDSRKYAWTRVHELPRFRFGGFGRSPASAARRCTPRGPLLLTGRPNEPVREEQGKRQSGHEQAEMQRRGAGALVRLELGDQVGGGDVDEITGSEHHQSRHFEVL